MQDERGLGAASPAAMAFQKQIILRDNVVMTEMIN